MILRAVIELRPDPACEQCFIDLTYTYNTVTDTHHAYIYGCRRDDRYSGTKGEIANVIAPYRGKPDVDELFDWLCR